MLASLRKIFGTRNDRILKRLWGRVAEVNAFEPAISALSDADLAAKTTEFKARLADGATLDQLLPEAFAVVRETAKRVLGERHYDVQLLGGIVLHEGKIPEMRTGEGKTLVSTAPAYLNALAGQGVHLVTVNDYLAQRDAEWMGRVHRFLGLTVGVVPHGHDFDAKRAAYHCDITYSTNNELGFDYLRDNMKFRLSDRVMRPFHYAIIDEVDSILIDEARTPLIISGPAEDATDLYAQTDAVVRQLLALEKTADAPLIELDEKTKTVLLSDEGVERVEQLLRDAGLLQTGQMYDAQNMGLAHHTSIALRAHKTFHRDKEYLLKDGQVVIIDEFTGRMMQGRRYSDGLHQAIEAKERVAIQRENQTLASVTFQNFFRMYPKFAGMTGTALTEAQEFAEIYNLDVVEIPTHCGVARLDQNDEIYRTAAEKNAAIVTLVKEAHAKHQPVLVGTVSIEKSEQLSALFTREKIRHAVLNARQHEQEAQIVAQAGRPGMVTVATNMAGRGTDIKLGGNLDLLVEARVTPDMTDADKAQLREVVKAEIERDRDIVLQAGGLLVIGSERHESRRIDNQLRGRSGRQGDPGASKFYISLEDDLMRIFGAERIDSVLQRLGIKEGQAIFHPWINTAIERAQKKVEGQHFDARRDVLKYDNVMNDQRQVIYAQRTELMTAASLSEQTAEIIDDVTLGLIEKHLPARSYKEQWQLDVLQRDLRALTGVDFPVADWAQTDGIGESEFTDQVLREVQTHWARKQQEFTQALGTPDALRDLERGVILDSLDKVWKEHLLNLDHVRQGIRWRGLAQRDPVNEYKAEAFTLFQSMLDDYRFHVAHALLSYNLTGAPDLDALLQASHDLSDLIETRLDPADGFAAPLETAKADTNAPAAANPPLHFGTARRQPVDAGDPATWSQTPRNELCPCGSGKKYKHCHGAVAAARA